MGNNQSIQNNKKQIRQQIITLFPHYALPIF